MYKAVLIDDEINALKMLELELKLSFPTIEVIQKFQNPLKAISFLQEHQPQLIFIDIEMPQINGIDLLKQVDTSYSKVIFLTAYKQYAIEAVRTNAIDYLLKPIDTEELKHAVSRALDIIKMEGNPKQEALIGELISSKNQLRIPTTNGFAFLKISDILYCKSDSNYTHIYTTEKEYIVSRTLKSIQESLVQSSFLRVHNSYLVNSEHIKEYSRRDGGYVILSNGINLRVSNSRKDIFKL